VDYFLCQLRTVVLLYNIADITLIYMKILLTDVTVFVPMFVSYWRQKSFVLVPKHNALRPKFDTHETIIF
jgi:hypothetical protein